MTDKEEHKKKAEAYLEKIRAAGKKMNSKLLELEVLRNKAADATAIRYDKDKVQTSPQNYMEMAMADIIELQAELEEDEAQIEEARGIAYGIMRKMEVREQRVILEWYYLQVEHMIEIAQRMNMSERSAYYLREDALEIFGTLMNL